MESRPSVLVVDDDLSWRLIYQEVLEEAGYLVKVAANKKDANQEFRERIFDVAIVDLRLKDKDPRNAEGVQVVKRLQELNVPTRIIVKSGYLTDKVRGQLAELRVFAVLDKEGPTRQLTELVANAVCSDKCQF